MGLYRKLLSLRNEVRKEKYDLMGTIDLLFETDIIRWVYVTLIVLSGITAIAVVIEKFFNFIGKPIKWFNKNNKDHELLLATSKILSELQEKQKEDVRQSIRHDEIIKEDLKRLSDMFIDLEIQDIRWNILNFCSDLSNGKEFSSEYYDYVFKLYDKYERMLKENGLTNGLIEQSISYIREKYHESLQNKTKE